MSGLPGTVGNVGRRSAQESLAGRKDSPPFRPVPAGGAGLT